MSIIATRILLLDTETGGTDPRQHDLLSVGLVVWQDGEIKDKKEVFVRGRPERCTSEALAINGIQLDKHNRYALPRQQALAEIARFIDAHFDDKPVTAAGHNLAFDLNFLRVLFEEGGQELNHYISHRTIDTASILLFLALLEGHPQDLREAASSSRAFAEYRIEMAPGSRHTALGDAVATAKLFTKMLHKLKKACATRAELLPSSRP